MKYRILVFMLLIMSLLHSKVVIDPNCKVTFGPSDVYISGGLQMDIVKAEEPEIDLTRKILGKDVRAVKRDIRQDVTKGDPKYPTITFDLNSRLYFIGTGDADLTNVYILHNATVAKPSGNLTINSDLLITGNLDFSSGNIVTGAYTLTLDPTIATLTNETATAYVIGNVQTSKLVGVGTSTFGGIGFQINNTGSNLGTVTITRETGTDKDVNIYGSNGINRKWTVGTSVAFAGTRSVTIDWLSNEDNGNVLGDLKAWKYEPTKGNSSFDEDIVIKKKMSMKSTAKAGIRSEREFTEDVFEDDIDDIIIGSDPKTLYWVEVDGASFNTASSPRTSTFTIDAATIFTINDALNAFADGSGTEANPYQIETLDQLDAVRYYLSACFIQIADIDASATTGWNAGAGWDPIDNLTGKYNGNGHTVSNLFIDRSTLYNGLFGYTTAGSEIKDLGLDNVNITGGDYTGGFVGYSRGTVKSTYSKGQISSTSGNRAGGFVGYATTGSFIYDCYSNVEVTRLAGGAIEYAAGFCGYHISGPIERCYSTGGVYYEGTTDPTDKGLFAYVGGGTRANNFWNTETSGQSSSAAGTGITTNEMRTLATFTDATWDFQDESANGVEDIWGMNYAEHNAFPFLSWQGITHDPISGFAGGMGTESEPYLISTPVELDNVRNFLGATHSDKYFLQTANLDLSGYQAGEGWAPLGDVSNYLSGNYDGGNHIISNLTINRPTTDYQGLFAYVYNTGYLSNLGVKVADVSGQMYSGVLVGRTAGSISNCFAEGNFTTTSYRSGGFTGYLNPGTISDCYAQVDVVRPSGATSDVAAFIGRLFLGTISNCYSTGSVLIDGSNPGNRGLIGSIGTTITVEDCFWDIESSGQTTSAGAATGKTTAEMQDVATYTATATVGLTNPWDFVGNPNNDVANEDIWNIHISLNGGYPYFEYEGRIPVLAPGNVALAYVAGDVTITWDAVTDAAGYAVYSSADPYGTFTLDESGAFNGEEWTITVGDSKMFYFVTATNATKSIPKVIEMSNSISSK